MSDNVIITSPGEQKVIDRFIEHQRAAGKRGGLSRSPRKIAACRRNLARVRRRRHDPAAVIEPAVPITNDEYNRP